MTAHSAAGLNLSQKFFKLTYFRVGNKQISLLFVICLIVDNN